jgi:hypothetical protein
MPKKTRKKKKFELIRTLTGRRRTRLEHLQQLSFLIPYPHKLVILGEMSQNQCSNSSHFPSSFLGDHQYLPHLPLNKGKDASPPIARDHLQLSLLSCALIGDGLVSFQIVGDGLVTGGRCVDPRLRGKLGPDPKAMVRGGSGDHGPAACCWSWIRGEGRPPWLRGGSEVLVVDLRRSSRNPARGRAGGRGCGQG